MICFFVPPQLLRCGVMAIMHPPLLPAPHHRVDIQNYRLRNWNASVQRQLLERPTEYLPGLQDAIMEYAWSSEDFAGEFDQDSEILVGLRGEFGELEVSPRNLNSSHLGKLVKVRPRCCAQHDAPLTTRVAVMHKQLAGGGGMLRAACRPVAAAMLPVLATPDSMSNSAVCCSAWKPA